MHYIKTFNEISMNDVPLVGGKNASLGQMITQLANKGITIPDGFAVTADAYWYYLKHNMLVDPIKEQLEKLTDINDIKKVQEVGLALRSLIINGTMPQVLADEIVQAYHALCKEYNQKSCDVAVRSSATAEDLPGASFAGQQETFLNITGDEHLLVACKKALASLFTNRALVYRVEKGFDHLKVALSIGVQKMIHSDRASSGVAFSLDTETGFGGVVMIDSSYGLGESIVQGLVNPDQFYVHKETLKQDFEGIIQKRLGSKTKKIIYSDDPKEPLATVDVSEQEAQQFSLTDDEIRALARMVVTIEDHYTEKKGSWAPMDIEWAKDGDDNKIYILQARPETIHSNRKKGQKLIQYELAPNQKKVELVRGLSIGQKIATGKARIVTSAAQIDKVQEGDMLITSMTDPDWVPAMKRAAAIITTHGGRTCHAAIISRELGTPALVGAANALDVIKDGQEVTLDCSQGMTGFVYEGALSFDKKEFYLEGLGQAPVDVMVNIADPNQVFRYAYLPVKGVGLARVEFIITNVIGIHPMALVEFDKVTDKKVRADIEQRTHLYKNKEDYFVDQLAYGVAMIAAAFYPKPVFVRFSDLKTNEYRNLLGGSYFEPQEENPMLGFRGASRYTNDRYKDAFALECAALKKVRDDMGFVNVQLMVPFVRTIHEAEQVIEELEHNGLSYSDQTLHYIMMCEVPSNVLLIDEFSDYFDGFSIGSNDLTQLVLGVDRDSGLLADLFDERNSAVKQMIKMALEGAKRNDKYSGLCGQAPSDYPEFAEFLIECGIDSVSLNPDAVVPFLLKYKE